MSSQARATCPRCHVSIALTGQGRFYAHGTGSKHSTCPGSGQTLYALTQADPEEPAVVSNTVPKHRWQAVVEATVASKRADCGHTVGSFHLYLRTEQVGGQTEVWSVCSGCATPDDYRYVIGTNKPPSRTRFETL